MGPYRYCIASLADDGGATGRGCIPRRRAAQLGPRYNSYTVLYCVHGGPAGSRCMRAFFKAVHVSTSCLLKKDSLFL